MVADQLEQHHIHAEIFGGYLQGGAGELPASGLVRVMVADEDSDRAGRIVAEWERTTTEWDNEHLNASSRARTLAGFALGLITGIAGTWLLTALPEAPQRTLYFDYNGDGREDAWQELVNERLVESRRDRNFDGQPDAWWTYRDGRVVNARRDDDFDGRVDFRLEYDNNQRLSGEMDADNNGVAEMHTRYRNGLLTEKEILDPEDGSLIRRLHYRQGKILAAEEVDTDGDGVPDERVEYDAPGAP